MDNQETQKLNPILPVEVICKVLSFVTAKTDLAQFRYVSKTWNEICCYHIRQKQLFPLKFFLKPGNDDYDYGAEEKIVPFSSLIEYSDASAVPFSSFELSMDDTPDLQRLTNFSEFVGPYVKKYSLQFSALFRGEPTPIFAPLLRHAKHLETLEVFGQSTLEPFRFDSSLVPYTMKLKNLILEPYASDTDWEQEPGLYFFRGGLGINGVMDLDTMSSWITCSPVLKVMKTEFSVHVKSGAEATKFRQLLDRFNLIELELEDSLILKALTAQPLATLRTLILDVKQDPEVVTNCLKSVSNTLKKLSIKLYCGTAHKIPALASLECLKFEFHNDEADPDVDLASILQYPLLPSEFPMLKYVTLGLAWQGLAHRYHAILFEGVFPTVEFLNLKYAANFMEPRWTSIFPNLKREGSPFDRQMYYLFENSPFGYRPEPNSKIFCMRKFSMQNAVHGWGSPIYSTLTIN